MHDFSNEVQKLYGIQPPDNFFEFYEWSQRLGDEDLDCLHNVLGIGLTGMFDVLDGEFQDVELRYPAMLHWRFVLDPPEFFTVLIGDCDGLHWGYWFDDPGRLPPVIASWYARDAFELWSPGVTLFETIYHEIDRAREDIEEEQEYEPQNQTEYEEQFTALDRLESTLPPQTHLPTREPTDATPEGMGVILSEEERNSEAGQLLLKGKELWGQSKQAFDILERAYTGLGRHALAAVVRAHATYPNLPRVDILEYRAGDYHFLDEALSEPEKVKTLDLGGKQLDELPDLSTLGNLEKLTLWGNRLTDLPATLLACEQLTSVNLYRNALKKVPEVLFNLSNLEDIQLSNNEITDIGTGWERLKKLKSLHLRGNPLDEGQIARLQKQLSEVDIVC